ncbi:MAG: hypothetical protein ACKVQK_27300 [Burkholderiales bacterium]
MKIVLTGIAVLVLGCITAAAQAETDLGKELYDLHCVQCHSDSLHKRPSPAARNYQEVREWVKLWARYVGAQWGKEDMEAVTRYLNNRFYFYTDVSHL